MIELDQVTFGYQPRRPPVISGLSLRMERGERLALAGPNGAGKTTVLQLMNGLLFARSGVVRFEGNSLTRRLVRSRDFRRDFRSRVVYLFAQSDAMLFNPTVHDEIAFSSRLLGLPDVEERVQRWARVFALTEHLSRAPFELSAGERRRTCLAAVFSLEPEVLLLDEPEADLDEMSIRTLEQLLLAENRTVVAATHSESFRSRVCTRTVSLEGSRVTLGNRK